MDKARPFCIAKREVWEAYKQVKANQGAAGVDEQSIAQFEENLSNNLYLIWSRMSSGSYMPPPVLRVEIPKDGGAGTRPLGIPTVSDRIAQTVVKRYLEPMLEAKFHPDSYGYRPGRSAHDALQVARTRCWKYDWVLDLDIKSFFDSLDWDLMMRAVRCHTECKWVLLYIERWLRAPVCMPDGTLVSRERGSPQGSVATPWTQRITLSLSGRFPYAAPIQSLICVTRSNIKMSYVALNSLRKGSAFECRLSSACRRSQPQRGRRGHGRRAQNFAASGLPLLARGAAHVVSGSCGRAHHPHHAQGSGGCCCHIARVRAGP